VYEWKPCDQPYSAADLPPDFNYSYFIILKNDIKISTHKVASGKILLKNELETKLKQAIRHNLGICLMRLRKRVKFL
jgi:hypothetical protein